MASRWLEIVGEFLARQSRPVALKRGVLHVMVFQSAVRYDLQRQWTKTVLEKLQAIYGPQVVKNVRFITG